MAENLFLELNSPLRPIPTGIEPRLANLPGIQAVIFDVYGTLVVSGTGDIGITQTLDKENELRSILQVAEITVATDTRLTDRFYGLIRTDHSASKAKGVNYPEVDILEIWETFLVELKEENLIEAIPNATHLRDLALRFECAVNPVWPMPGMAEILEHLKSAGIPLGIVSNAQFYTPLMLESFTGKTLAKLGFAADLCVWSYEERLGKPSVELFEKLKRSLARMGIAAENTLYIGNDMLNDIWTATQVGLRAALFAGDQRSLRLRETDERCHGLIPDAVLTELSQLRRIFQKSDTIR